QAAAQYGECVDMPFPAVDPSANKEDIEALTDEYLQKIMDIAKQEDSEPVVHLMGEMTFLFTLANKLKDKNIRCIASTSERNTIELGNGQKEIHFTFVQFRDYF
ncbi:MAG TPA: CRISPR-associated protein, partial [Bacteroidales bacterium]|nr:CRISPR-associated protein [Bacteroidales bacterium]